MLIRKLYKYFIFIILFLISFINFNYATTLIKQNLDGLVKNAELIFIGKVTSITSTWGDGGNTIYTYVTFSELEIIDGLYFENIINLKFEGGRIGPHRLIIPGIPEFEIGEKNLLFMRGNDVSKCPLSGWCQGRFKIVEDKLTLRNLVVDDFGNRVINVSNYKLIKEQVNIKFESQEKKKLSLEDFIFEIHKTIKSISPQYMRKRIHIKNIEIPIYLNQKDISLKMQELLNGQIKKGKVPKKEIKK